MASQGNIALNFSRRAAAGSGLPVSQFVHSTASDTTAGPTSLLGYHACFLPLADGAHLASSAGITLIPLPAADTVEATPDGPSLDVRRALIRAALPPDRTDLVVVGGSLQHSTWGRCGYGRAHPLNG